MLLEMDSRKNSASISNIPFFQGRGKEIAFVAFFIFIIFLLVSMSLDSARIRARDAKRLEEKNQLVMAIRMYEIDHGAYPGLGIGEWSCLGLSDNERCWNGMYAGNSELNKQLSKYMTNGFPSPGLPEANGLGGAYLYRAGKDGFFNGKGGVYLIWSLENDIEGSRCNTEVRTIEGRTYCYERISGK